MAYTVKQVAAMSGVSVRTLHFYDETGLLKPAYLGANNYRYYEEPQLLLLQQILFYRELGIGLEQIKTILGHADFEKVAALQSHRKVMQKQLTRTRTLLETIDRTLKHLKGTEKMKTEQLFAGFSVAAGRDRFDAGLKLGGEPVDCKVSGADTEGALCVFEFKGGWPHHLHHNQDEWIYIIDGEWEFVIGEKRFRAGAGESIFIPRNTRHIWAPIGDDPGKVINVYQPAGTMEDFFRAVASYADVPTREQVEQGTVRDEQVHTLHRLFATHGMDLLPPPVVVGPAD